MRRRLQRILYRALSWLTPKPDQSGTIRTLNKALLELSSRDNLAEARYMEDLAELVEARQMAGSGPWSVSPATLRATDDLIETAKRRIKTREALPISAQGAYGDIELALQNVEWRREVNLSWLEFSRWGIQQIILITRLHYVKNPIIRRLVDVCAAYVFARGVEISSDDETANEVLREFQERNKATLGQNALTDLERRKDYDGNIFFVLFPDTQNTGRVAVRTIDATEIQDIVCDPNDADTPWFYRRVATVQDFDIERGTISNRQDERWYPALNYEPDDRPVTIGGKPVEWSSPIYHRKCGGIAKWRFGCPRIYPALDWAKEAKKYLEYCAANAAALAQIALTFTTKGGQQAIEGAKSQLGTSMGPNAALWDTDPTPVSGATFASGPGSKLEAFKTQGAGLDPEKCRQYKLMACMTKGVPETFLGDVSTGNLATATTLDRPTETVMLGFQEEWREDFVVLSAYELKMSARASGGKLREAFEKRLKESPQTLDPRSRCFTIREAAGHRMPNGRWVYDEAAPQPGVIQVRADFPAIREGDIPALVNAVVAAATMGNHAGQIIGLDEREAVRKLGEILGIERNDEIVDSMYPEADYDPNRAHQIVDVPIPRQMPGGEVAYQTVKNHQPELPPMEPQEAARLNAAFRRLAEAMRQYERTSGNGDRSAAVANSRT